MWHCLAVYCEQDSRHALATLCTMFGWRRIDVSAKVMALQVIVRAVVYHATDTIPSGRNLL